MCKNENYLIQGSPNHPRSCHFYETHIHNMGIIEPSFLSIYKFYDIKKLKYVLTNKKLYLDRIQDSWEDKFENFFMKEKFIVDNEDYSIVSICRGVFGQSWTTLPESDALWRINSPDKNGVRIQTKAGKLIDATSVGDSSSYDTWYGRVIYDDQDVIERFVSEQCSILSTSILRNLLPYSEFLKRREFEHEHEFRVIKILDEETSNKVEPYKRICFSIDPADFIEGYLLDPRLSEAEFEKKKNLLRSLGADIKKVSQSKLYQFEPIEIRMRTE